MDTVFLVGSSGFVGTNLAKQYAFDGLYRSNNVREAYGKNPQILVYAGVRSEMFTANKDPEADRQHILGAIENISKINPRLCVLISSIAVYSETSSVDENTEIDMSKLSPYGKNRLLLEQWVEKNVSDYLIVRLPAIFGYGLKKNFLYDYIHRVPALLTEKKLRELAERLPEINEFYVPRGDGFFKCIPLDADSEKDLKQILQIVKFDALQFTDSRSKYQFYDLQRLWCDIDLALKHGLKKINLATPPISVAELYQNLSGEPFENRIEGKTPYNYDMRTINGHLFDHQDGYIMSLEEEVESIRKFVASEGGVCF